jgi:ParB-like chromosome segregation protein Spo0J
MKPDGTEEFILLDQIVVTEGFLNSNPSVDKIQQVMNHFKRTGCLDEPITIKRDTKILTDGYIRYIVAKKMGLDLVPIAYENILLHNHK